MNPIAQYVNDFNLKEYQYLSQNELCNLLMLNLPSSLNDKEKNNYLDFLTAFMETWNLIYDSICKMEYHNYKNSHFHDQDNSYSIGYDEFAYYYPNFNEDTFIILNKPISILKELYTKEEIQDIIRSHLKILSQIENISFTYETFNRKDIYHFKGRLNVYYKAFLIAFDYERKNGLRKSAIIDEEEVKSYIKNHFKRFNPYFKNKTKTY